MYSEREKISVLPVQCTLNTAIDNKPIQIDVFTEYPFKNIDIYRVTTQDETKFNLKLPLPTWAESVIVNGETIPKPKYYSIKKRWSGIEEIHIVTTNL